MTISVSCDWSVAIFTTALESQESYLTLRNFILQTCVSNTRDCTVLSHTTFARLYNAAASPASRLRSAGSLTINRSEGANFETHARSSINLQQETASRLIGFALHSSWILKNLTSGKKGEQLFGTRKIVTNNGRLLHLDVSTERIYAQAQELKWTLQIFEAYSSSLLVFQQSIQLILKLHNSVLPFLGSQSHVSRPVSLLHQHRH